MSVTTETFPFDGGRSVTAFIPQRAPEMIVYCGDGQLIPQWGADLAKEGLPPTMVLGVHAKNDETLRLHEYSPGFDPTSFERHEAFVVGDVRSWVRSSFGPELPPERTAFFGVSASAELALAMGVRHPDILGAVFAASPGAGYRPTGEIQGKMPPTYFVAGRKEPFFLDNASRWATALRDGGNEVMMVERDAGHDDAMWRAEFPKMIAWFCSHLR